MSVELRPHLTVDTRNLHCPSPVLKAQEAIGQLHSGQILQVLATDPAAESDIRAWAKRAGHAFLDSTEDGHELTFLIQKG